MNERKLKILEAIIRDYIETGDPVGSRTISKKYDLGISSATIRNEMADLEELGLIVQPHTSAGRIPSDKGYRLYVDGMMQKTNVGPEVRQIITNLIKENVTRVETLVDRTAKLVSLLTNCTTIAMTPSLSKVKIKHIQLVPVDEHSIVCVLVTDTKSVKNHIIETPKSISYNMCFALSNVLNENLRGKRLSEVSLDEIRKTIESEMSEYGDIAASILHAIDVALRDEDTTEVFIRGANNILDFDDYKDKEKARQLFKVLEEKPNLTQILDEAKPNEVTVKIGEENNFEPMKDYSVVTTSYSLGDNVLGNIGIIGPTRMNYEQVVGVLEFVSYYISQMLNNI